MRKVVYYEAQDGKKFETEAEALAYEADCSTMKKMQEIMQEIKNYCAERDCSDCVFNQEGCIFSCSNCPLDWRSEV